MPPPIGAFPRKVVGESYQPSSTGYRKRSAMWKGESGAVSRDGVIEMTDDRG